MGAMVDRVVEYRSMLGLVHERRCPEGSVAREIWISGSVGADML